MFDEWHDVKAREKDQADLLRKLEQRRAVLRSVLTGRRAQLLAFFSIYLCGIDVVADLSGNEALRLVSHIHSLPASRRVSFNVAKNACDASQSKTQKLTLKATFVCNDADFQANQAAQARTLFAEHLLAKNNFPNVRAEATLNATIFGSSYVVIAPGDDGPRLLNFSPLEAMHEIDDLREVHFCRRVRKSDLAEEFPDLLMEIDESSDRESDLYERTSDIYCAERLSVHVRGGKTRFVRWIDRAVLDDRTVDGDGYVQTIRWTEVPSTEIGIGLVEQIMPIQSEINRMAQSIQESHNALGQPKLGINRAAKVKKNQLTNGPSYLEFSGDMPPVPLTYQVISQTDVAYMDNLYRKAYETAGVNMLDASAKKPAGLESAPALREYADIASERFASWSSEVQRLVGAVSDALVRMAEALGKPRSINTGATKITLAAASRAGVKIFAQPEVGSAMPNKIEGRIARVNELLENEYISPLEGLELIDMPDLRSFTAAKLAPRRHYSACLAAILNGSYDPLTDTPDPRIPEADTGLAMAKEVYAQVRRTAPKPMLDRLRLYMDQLLDIMLGKEPRQDEAGGAPGPEAAPPPPEAAAPPPEIPAGPPPPLPPPPPMGAPPPQAVAA